jgi:CRISPR-associated protein Cst1
VPLLDWTGHALVDVGIATLCAMTGRSSPIDLTPEDLDRAASEMEAYYFSGALTSYLSCVFTMNAGYTQPSPDPTGTRRKEYTARILFAHRVTEPQPRARGLRCVVSGLPATDVIDRCHMPMITGEGVLNFFPAGTGGLPIHGPYLTALQALPLGGRRCEGKLLIAHSDAPLLTLAFARRYLEDNRRLINLATENKLPRSEGADPTLPREQASWDAQKKRAKMPDAKSAPTLVTADLMSILEDQTDAADLDRQPASVTVYWLSNSGQGPSLQVFDLPSNLIAFLNRARMASAKPAWGQIIARAWPQPEPEIGPPRRHGTRRPRPSINLTNPGVSRNEALTDLFLIFAGGIVDASRARLFLRRCVLPALQLATEDRASFWHFTELFLEEVLAMSSDHIKAIREFADNLAAYIHRRNDRRLLAALLYEKSAWAFRNALVKAQRNQFRDKAELLFGLEEYLKVFVSAEGAGVADWRLVRDLISIRLTERLYELGLKPEDLPAEEEAETVAVEETE